MFRFNDFHGLKEESRHKNSKTDPIKIQAERLWERGQTRMMGTDSELPDLKGRFARWIHWMRAVVIAFRSNSNSLTS